jgi:hypothetical protein
MERGPLALFSAIVAVGLGPALWLGVQFGSVGVAPQRPPAVSEVEPDSQQLLGGRGAGSDTTADDGTVVKTKPRADVRPITSSPTPSPSGSPSPSDPAPSASPSATADPSDDPAPTPTDPTVDPTDPPGGDESEDPTVPPEPPKDGDAPGGGDPSEPADDGGIAPSEPAIV